MNTLYAGPTDDWCAQPARNCQSKKEVWLVIHRLAASHRVIRAAA